MYDQSLVRCDDNPMITNMFMKNNTVINWDLFILKKKLQPPLPMSCLSMLPCSHMTFLVFFLTFVHIC